eukprot:g3527.t1
MPDVPVPPVRGDESVAYRSPMTHMASSRAQTCPPTCFCSKLTWNCDSVGLTSAPIGMPKTIMSASFHNNNIEYIPSNFLKNLPLLQIVDLRNNKIKNITAGAFTDLPELATILLDDNQISGIEVGSFVNLPGLTHIRITNNSLTSLAQGTFENLPLVETIRLSINPNLSVIEPGTFRNLDSLLRIQMNGTATNYTHLGPYNYGKGSGERTFAPGCPKLREIDLGRTKIRAIEPDTLQDSDFIVRARRVSRFAQYSTLLSECDLLNQYELILEFDTVSTTTICMPKQGALLSDSPSTSQKDHLNPTRRRVLTEEDFALLDKLNPGANPPASNVPHVIHGMPVYGEDHRRLVESLDAGIVYEETLDHEAFM